MSNKLVVLERLRKEYPSVVALRDAQLEIGQGDIFGLIGPNGAGKTTLLRLLATTLEPTAGRALFRGRDIWERPTEYRRHIGYMPDFFHLYENLKVRELLVYFGKAHGLRGRGLSDRVDEVLGIIGLAEKSNGFVKGLSRGMMQRLALGRAIIHKPPLLLLDEPASGLDPMARRDLFAALRHAHGQGSTILISSHILGELSELCTSVGIMDHGVFLESGTTEEIIRKIQPRRQVSLVVVGDAGPAQAILAGQSGVSEVKFADGRLHFAFEGDNAGLAGINATLVGQGVKLALAEEVRTSLHEVYFTIADRQGK